MKRAEKPTNLYEMLPRYVTEPVELSDDTYLPAIARDFEWEGLRLTFVFSPAKIWSESGGDKHYYPGDREKLIEIALRKLTLPENINFRQEEWTLDFSFTDLMKLISGISGDSAYKEEDIRLGLEILGNVTYQLLTEKAELHFRPVERLQKVEKDGEIYYRARFSELFFNRMEHFDICFLGKKVNKTNLQKT
ncbi:MAG: hypothetical protein WA584_17705 [Pyrinomonadaceae bacterium]